MSNNTVKISFIGDIMCEHTRLDSYKKEDGSYDFSHLFSPCKDLFLKSDYVVANLETPVAGKELKYSFKDYNFNTPEEILSAIKNNGVNMVTTANNHCLDRGKRGIDYTIDNLNNYGIDFTGTTHSNCAPKPFIKSVGKIKIGILSYTYGTEACYNGCYLNKKNDYLVNLFQKQELSSPLLRLLLKSNRLLVRVVRKALRVINPHFFKKSYEDYRQRNRRYRHKILNDIYYLKTNNVDIIIACLHTGGQFNDKPTQITQETCSFFIKNGVDLIVCNHEHIVQRIDFYDGKAVAYCLGNFTSNYGIERKPYNKQVQCSICFNVYLTKIDNTLSFDYSFNVLFSKLDSNGQIATYPLYDLYINTVNDNEKEEYASLISQSVSRFVGIERKTVVPKKEYFVNDLLSERKMCND